MNTTLGDLAELAEAEWAYRYTTAAPADVAESFGSVTARIGGGLVLGRRHDTAALWNRALAFGISTQATAEVIDEIIGFYRDHEIPKALIQIAPTRLPEDWAEICARHGLKEVEPWAKLGAAVDDLRPDASASLRVEPVDKSEALLEWAEVVLEGMGGVDERSVRRIGAATSGPDFRPYGVWEGEQLIAGGNLLVYGPVASLNTAATLPGHRGKGAQAALIAARIEEARRAGCRWVVAEAELDGTSHKNLERAGLRLLYARQNWLWEAAAGE